MKKTKILLVLAIAMLAMFAMSACGLVSEGITKVEFDVMPKNYFTAAELEDGLSVSFKVYTTTNDEGVEVTVTVTENTLSVSDPTGIVTTEVEGFSTEMGEHNLVVKVNDGVAKATYAYRVCEEVATLFELQTAGANGGYYILTANVTGTSAKDGAVLDVTAAPFVLYGENHSITADTNSVNSSNAVINVNGNNFADPEGKDGLFEFNNVKAVGGLKNGTSHYPNRGMNFANLDGATININACYASGLYALRFTRSDDLTVNISNGSTADGWAALYTFSSNSIFNIDDVTLSGTNYYSGTSNDFGTLVVDGDAWDWNQDGTPDNAPGTLGFNNVINVTNCVITNTTNTECNQYLVVANPGAAKNVINLVGCTDADGKALVLVKNLADFCDNVGSVIYKDGKYVYDMKALDATMRNKLYIDGQLYDVDDITAINK